MAAQAQLFICTVPLAVTVYQVVILLSSCSRQHPARNAWGMATHRMPMRLVLRSSRLGVDAGARAYTSLHAVAFCIAVPYGVAVPRLDCLGVLHQIVPASSFPPSASLRCVQSSSSATRNDNQLNAPGLAANSASWLCAAFSLDAAGRVIGTVKGAPVWSAVQWRFPPIALRPFLKVCEF